MVRLFIIIGSQPLLSQVEFECFNQQWSSNVLGITDDNVITGGIQANLTTPLRKDCAFCVNPTRQSPADPVNHCIGERLRNTVY